MPKRKDKVRQVGMFDIQEYLSTAPCVPALRAAVHAWRESGYKGCTDTTLELLNFWFKTDNRLPNGQHFFDHRAQREAMEALVYV